MDSFVLLAYASLAASKTLLQQLLAFLNFTLHSEDLLSWYKWKNRFLWIMAAAAEAAENHHDEWVRVNLILTMRDIYINSNLNQLTKFTSRSGNTKFRDILEHLSNDHRDHANQQENSHRLCSEMRHSLLSLKKSQWRQRQQHDQDFPIEEKPLWDKY